MNGRRLLAILAAVSALTLVGVACSSNDNGGGSTGGATGGATGGGSTGGGASVTMSVKDFEFDPSTVPVSSGETTITITNNGAVQHSFTLDDNSVSQIIAPGATETVTVNITADAGFHCQFHSQMTGTLTVG